MNISKQLKRLHEYLDSEEGKEHARQYWEKIEFASSMDEKWEKKIAALSKEELYEFIDKCIEKYNSDKYINKEYKRGCEPRMLLFWRIHEALQLLPRIIVEKEGEHISGFNLEALNLDNKYIARILYGQGAVCQIYKI